MTARFSPKSDITQAGGLAGTSVDLLFFPIDTIKTRLQSAQGFSHAGGFKGIYKGVGSVVVGSAPGGKAQIGDPQFSVPNIDYVVQRLRSFRPMKL